jgi:2-C-methyl-D-erythritol 4-phosphate cytidylyltransferase
MNMTRIDDLSIVIPAAGGGERLGLGPKALLLLDGRPLLHWICAKARALSPEVIVAVPPGCLSDWAAHCPGCRLIEGGETHLASMARLIQAASLSWLMNLNVSMPFTPPHLMRAVAEAAKADGIAGAFLPLELPLASIVDGKVRQLLPRRQTGIAQGPNAYRRQYLLDLIARADDEDWGRQSFLEIALRHGHAISAVPGEKTNIKITTPEDWRQAQHLKEYLE